MSRTEKDKPYWVLKREGSWRTKVGYPPAIAGAWRDVDSWEKLYWGQQRCREREAFARMEEPEPSRHRHEGKWNVW